MEGDVVLPGYTVVRRLGSGDSAMWLAREDATGEPVTLRFIAAANAGVRQRLVAALPTLQSIDHPHIAPLFDVVETPQGYVAVLGAAEGGSLAAIVAQHGTLTFGQVITACAPIADGLAEFHQHGIVHGAITLDDIVFTLDGRPMIVGVGLLQAGAEFPSARGSLAPEVLSGAPPSPKADTYSLATVAVVAMTGYLPQRPLVIDGLPPSAQAVLERALGQPPMRPDAGTLANALYTIADPEPVELATEQVEGTGSLPTVTEPLAGTAPGGDISSYMRESVPGRRARRSAESADADAPVEEPAAEPDAPAGRRSARPAEGRRTATDR
ncbi:MAG TPA: protein kinase, partial [Jiangellaceae bacterium]|nr:protein kinase [Jiangellaceae bacterium]